MGLPPPRRRGRLAALGLSALLATAIACQPVTPPPQAGFADEFDGTSLGRAWHPNRWFSSVCAAGATSGEQQWYRPGAATVSDGTLVLTATAGQNSCNEGSWSGTRPYASGWVQTGGVRSPSRTTPPGYQFTFGRVDVRFKVDAGAGLWPAIWLLSAGTPRADGSHPYPSRPEIDVLELYGDQPDLWKFHLHSTATDGSLLDPGSRTVGPDTSSGWHVASVEWRSDHITWFVDGTPAWTYRGPGIPQEPLYLILNLAVGGHAGTPDPAAFPATMQVDYVRITP
ncbi:MAG: glycoside hydrolase family 16 protein [Acidimicrobiales bacterium]|nr:glycoside hydrolase family 16 protein [Acidimicrobiales bacterium]